jgi:hypothetical protein
VTLAPLTLAFNGIDGATGRALVPPCTIGQVASWARGKGPEASIALQRLRARKYGFAAWDEQDLARAGWGVVFHSDAAPAVVEALQPLLRLRREQAGARYREFAGPDGYLQGDVADLWLRRSPRLKGPGRADPERVPYHLLLVGSPAQIPFRFQYELGLSYSVGRLSFDDAEDAERYAKSVVASECRPCGHARVTLFGTCNSGDVATRLSSDRLVAPLSRDLGATLEAEGAITTIACGEASKEALRHVYAGHRGDAALLFTATHGVSFPLADPRQAQDQGALLCQDWPGPGAAGAPLSPEHYFSAADLPIEANLSGLVCFHFGCYTAGTPRFDDYVDPGGLPRAIAAAPFLSALARAELGRGALAVIGHVDRAWSCSFSWPDAEDDHAAFAEALRDALRGSRVGPAMGALRLRYADLSIRLNALLDDERHGARCDDFELAGLWTANMDARSYVILGDPAARLGAG